MKNALYVLAGLVVAGTLVMFALGPGQDLLRRKTLRPPVEDGVELNSLEPQHPGAISPPQKIEAFAGVSIGWWFDEGVSLVLTSGSRWGRLNENLEPTLLPTRSGPLQSVLDLGGPTQVMVAVIQESNTSGRLLVGLNREGREVWRQGPLSEERGAAPTMLYGEERLQGALVRLERLGGGLVLNLKGEDLWDSYTLDRNGERRTSARIPGLLVQISRGKVEWFSHNSGFPDSYAGRFFTSEAPDPTDAERAALPQVHSFAMDGILFENREAQPRLLLECAGALGGTWLLSEDQEGVRTWGIHITDRESGRESGRELEIAGLANLGRSNGTTYFGVVLNNGTVLVLDEGGILLDQTHLPDTEDAVGAITASGVSGGTLANGEHVLLVDTALSMFLLKVELP